MSVNKSTRQLVYDKYKGHCAYCGVVLVKIWHVDHIQAQRRRGTDDITNLNPSCIHCNNWKLTHTIEEFRHEIEQQPERALKYSRNYKMSVRYGLVALTHKPVVFYFETVKPHIDRTIVVQNNV